MIVDIAFESGKVRKKFEGFYQLFLVFIIKIDYIGIESSFFSFRITRGVYSTGEQKLY